VHGTGLNGGKIGAETSVDRQISEISSAITASEVQYGLLYDSNILSLLKCGEYIFVLVLG